MQEDVWECSQCFSCVRCPRGNNPGGVILVMREVAVNNGLASAREALEGYSRIIYKIMSTGTQVSPDMLQPDAFPDWGPEVKDVSDNLDLWRRALPPETHHTTSTGWDVDEKTLLELYLIWFHTGALDIHANRSRRGRIGDESHHHRAVLCELHGVPDEVREDPLIEGENRKAWEDPGEVQGRREMNRIEGAHRLDREGLAGADTDVRRDLQQLERGGVGDFQHEGIGVAAHRGLR